jgi:biopolymer transport protein ExbB
MAAFLDFITLYWYFAAPLFLLSVTGIGLVYWRLLLNIQGNTVMSKFLPVFQEKLEKEGLNAALAFCRSRFDVIPRRLFVAGLEVQKQGIAAVRRSMAEIIEAKLLPEANFLLPAILITAKIATMVGLLVTVMSMIRTFMAIQQAQQLNVGRNAGEIGLALVGTAMGLVCAIPLVFAHFLFKAWIGYFEKKLQSSAQKLLFLLQDYNGKAGKNSFG